MALRVGDPAPPFRLPSTEGEISLASALERGPVLLVFYPGDDTVVCTAQLCDYRDNLATFAELGVQVLALNPQPLESHRRFAKKHALPFPLLSDEGGEVCRLYGARGLLGLTRRALVLIDGEGIVRFVRTDLPIFRRTAAELRSVLREALGARAPEAD